MYARKARLAGDITSFGCFSVMGTQDGDPCLLAIFVTSCEIRSTTNGMTRHAYVQNIFIIYI